MTGSNDKKLLRKADEFLVSSIAIEHGQFHVPLGYLFPPYAAWKTKVHSPVVHSVVEPMT